MQINCTVIIQAFNFLVTYLFLRKFFFRPVVKLIEQKETAKSILADKLKAKELFVNSLLAKKNKDLDKFRDEISQQYQRPAQPTIQLEKDVLTDGHKIEVTKEVVEEFKQIIKKGVNSAF